MYLLYNIVYLLHLVESNQFYNLYCEHPLNLEEKLAIIKKTKQGETLEENSGKVTEGGSPSSRLICVWSNYQTVNLGLLTP